MFSQLLSTIKVKIVDKTMQIANLCVILHVKHKKISCPAVLTCFLIAHVRYIKHDSNTTPRFHDRIYCFAIPIRDMNTKKTKPNLEKKPESLGVMLEF